MTDKLYQEYNEIEHKLKQLDGFVDKIKLLRTMIGERSYENIDACLKQARHAKTAYFMYNCVIANTDLETDTDFRESKINFVKSSSEALEYYLDEALVSLADTLNWYLTKDSSRNISDIISVIPEKEATAVRLITDIFLEGTYEDYQPKPSDLEIVFNIVGGLVRNKDVELSSALDHIRSGKSGKEHNKDLDFICGILTDIHMTIIYPGMYKGDFFTRFDTSKAIKATLEKCITGVKTPAV